jgi:uncharacterized DUF497 family protein
MPKRTFTLLPTFIELTRIKYIQYTTNGGSFSLEFDWDETKNRKNYTKHGVWFEEAVTVFCDRNALEIFDDDHSQGEERFILMGLSTKPRLLIVIYCERNGNNTRIISARNATKKEAKDYEKGI